MIHTPDINFYASNETFPIPNYSTIGHQGLNVQSILSAIILNESIDHPNLKVQSISPTIHHFLPLLNFIILLILHKILRIKGHHKSNQIINTFAK